MAIDGYIAESMGHDRPARIGITIAKVVAGLLVLLLVMVLAKRRRQNTPAG